MTLFCRQKRGMRFRALVTEILSPCGHHRFCDAHGIDAEFLKLRSRVSLNRNQSLGRQPLYKRCRTRVEVLPDCWHLDY